MIKERGVDEILADLLVYIVDSIYKVLLRNSSEIGDTFSSYCERIDAALFGPFWYYNDTKEGNRLKLPMELEAYREAVCFGFEQKSFRTMIDSRFLSDRDLHIGVTTWKIFEYYVEEFSVFLPELKEYLDKLESGEMLPFISKCVSTVVRLSTFRYTAQSGPTNIAPFVDTSCIQQMLSRIKVVFPILDIVDKSVIPFCFGRKEFHNALDSMNQTVLELLDKHSCDINVAITELQSQRANIYSELKDRMMKTPDCDLDLKLLTVRNRINSKLHNILDNKINPLTIGAMKKGIDHCVSNYISAQTHHPICNSIVRTQYHDLKFIENILLDTPTKILKNLLTLPTNKLGGLIPCS